MKRGKPGRRDRGGKPGPKPRRDFQRGPAGSTDPPEGLTHRELAHWNALAPNLRQAGLFTALDVPMFATLCRKLALMDEVSEEIEKGGLIQKTKRGSPRPSVWLRIFNQEQAMALRIAQEFGLTPNSRSRIHVEIPATGAIHLVSEADEEAQRKIDEHFFGPRPQ